MEDTLVWTTLIAIIALFCQKLDAQTASPTASLYLPQGDVLEGDETAALTCQIGGPPAEYEVVFLRQLQTGANDILFINSHVPHNMRDKYSVSKRTQHIYSLTIWNITRADAGRYVCRLGVSSGATNAVTFVASGSAIVDVFFLPDLAASPDCSLVDRSPEYHPSVGETIQMECVSLAGNPIVNMKWLQNGKWDIANSRVSKPSSSSGIVVSVLDVTMLPEHETAVFTCEITSPGFPTFSHSCTIGPFVTPPVTPSVVHPRFTSATLGATKLVKSQNSVGESDSGMMSTFKVPIFAGAAGLMCLFIIIIAIVVVKRRRNQTKESEHRDSRAHLTINAVNGVENGNSRPDRSPSVQHISAPNEGPMYALIHKDAGDEHGDSTKNMPDVLSRSKTLPIISIAKQTNKSYPPPPSYPTEQQQHEINNKMDKSCLTGGAKYTRTRNSYQNASVASASPSQNRERRQTEPNISANEYATLEEFATQDSPLSSRSKRNSTGLYNTVSLY